MKKAETPNRLIHGVFTSILEYQKYLKSVPDVNLRDAAITLRMNETDTKYRLKCINAEQRRRAKQKARPYCNTNEPEKNN